MNQKHLQKESLIGLFYLFDDDQVLIYTYNLLHSIRSQNIIGIDQYKFISDIFFEILFDPILVFYVVGRGW